MESHLSDPKAQPPLQIGWSEKQRRVIWLFLCVLCAGLLLAYFRNPTFIDDPAPEMGPRAGELADRLDPNVADWRELAAISGLGQVKARAIVDYRKQWLALHPGGRAFGSAQDLRRIKGIGPATITNLAPYLYFPAHTDAATNPSR